MISLQSYCLERGERKNFSVTEQIDGPRGSSRTHGSRERRWHRVRTATSAMLSPIAATEPSSLATDDAFSSPTMFHTVQSNDVQRADQLNEIPSSRSRNAQTATTMTTTTTTASEQATDRSFRALASGDSDATAPVVSIQRGPRTDGGNEALASLPDDRPN